MSRPSMLDHMLQGYEVGEGSPAKGASSFADDKSLPVDASSPLKLHSGQSKTLSRFSCCRGGLLMKCF